MTHPYSFGIEEEYFIVDRRSGGIRAELSAAFFKALGKRFGGRVMNELLQCQIEVATRPHTSFAEARAELLEFRAGISEIGRDHGVGIIAAGTHPMARSTQMLRTRKRRYDKVIADLQMVGLTNVLSGLHVHVEVPDPARRVEIMYRMIPFLPVFLALSTSSPFWEGNETGLLGYRNAVNDSLPRTGLPELFRSVEEYESYIGKLVEARIIPDSSYVWWSLRPSLAHPTLELRVSDCCTSVEDALAIAALFRSLARHLCANPHVHADLMPIGRALAEENVWRAQRYGTDGTYLDVATGEARPFKQEFVRLRELIADDAEALGCEAQIEHARTIMSRGTSAHRQLALYKALRAAGRPHVAALREVARWLKLSTEAGDFVTADSPPNAAVAA